MKNIKLNELPSQEYLQSLYNYNPETGEVRCKERPRESFKNNHSYTYFLNKTLPNPVGTNKGDGYLIVSIDGVLHRLHRLIWKMYYGEDPKHFIDHINGIRNDNRISNLREATIKENNRNRNILDKRNSTGTTGITLLENGKYYTRICYNSVSMNIGYFDSLEEAKARRIILEKALYKEFYVKNDDFENSEYYINFVNNLTEEQLLEYTTFKAPDKLKLAKTGYVGVEYVGENSYSARFSYNKIRYYLGVFNTSEEAALARENKLKELKSLNTTET